MKLSPYLNIKRLEFIVTDNCTGRCKHCSFIERVENKPLGGFNHVNIKETTELIRTLSKYYKIESVMTFGGEPLLYPEITAEIHKEAKICGIEKRQIITNGYFTNDNTRMEETAFMLKNAGVNDLLLSVDVFHQEKIPLEKVKVFAEFLVKAEVKTKLQPAWVVNRSYTNNYNSETERILSELKYLNLKENEGNDIFLSGNALKYLKEYYPEREFDLKSKCGEMPYTEKLTSVTSLSLEPNGDIKVCDFTVGNIYKEDIEKIICEYDPNKNEWMKAVTENGAFGLISLCKTKNINIDTEGCFNVCDLCRKIKKINI